MKGEECKLLAFADNMTFTLENPELSLITLMKRIRVWRSSRNENKLGEDKNDNQKYTD